MFYSLGTTNDHFVIALEANLTPKQIKKNDIIKLFTSVSLSVCQLTKFTNKLGNAA